MEPWPALGLSAMPRDEESPATPAERARWAAVEALFHDRPVTDLAQAWVEEELRVIEAAESVKAWADAQGLAALARLREAVGMVVQEQTDTISMYDDGVLRMPLWSPRPRPRPWTRWLWRPGCRKARSRLG